MAQHERDLDGGMPAASGAMIAVTVAAIATRSQTHRHGDEPPGQERRNGSLLNPE